MRRFTNVYGPLRNGYAYHKQGRPPERREEGTTLQRRYRQTGLTERIKPLYDEAGRPFGNGEAGLLVWLAFGRRTRSN